MNMITEELKLPFGTMITYYNCVFRFPRWGAPIGISGLNVKVTYHPKELNFKRLFLVYMIYAHKAFPARYREEDHVWENLQPNQWDNNVITRLKNISVINEDCSLNLSSLYDFKVDIENAKF